MCFDDIPEDLEQAFPCECGGSIKLSSFSGLWECDTCELSYVEESEPKDEH